MKLYLNFSCSLTKNGFSSSAVKFAANQVSSVIFEVDFKIQNGDVLGNLNAVSRRAVQIHTRIVFFQDSFFAQSAAKEKNY